MICTKTIIQILNFFICKSDGPNILRGNEKQISLAILENNPALHERNRTKKVGKWKSFQYDRLLLCNVNKLLNKASTWFNCQLEFQLFKQIFSSIRIHLDQSLKANFDQRPPIETRSNNNRQQKNVSLQLWTDWNLWIEKGMNMLELFIEKGIWICSKILLKELS